MLGKKKLKLTKSKKVAVPPRHAPNNGTGPVTNKLMRDQINLQVIAEMQSLPHAANIQSQVCGWQWTEIDGIRVPYVRRDNGNAYSASRVVQHTLFARFNQSMDALQRHLPTHNMTVIEAATFNTVNVLLGQYGYGVDIFHGHCDSLVGLDDVRRHYWSQKHSALHVMLLNTEAQLAQSPRQSDIHALVSLVRDQVKEQLMQARVCYEAVDNALR